MASCRFFPQALLAAALLPVAPARGHGDLHESIERISKEIEARPDQAPLLWTRASLYSRHGDHEKAMADLTAMAALEPENDLAQALRGEVLHRMGRLEEARAEQEAFLGKHPQHRQVQWDYCRTLADSKDTAAALRELDDLLGATEHPSPDAVELRLSLTEAAGPDGPAQALAWLDGFLARHPLPVFQEHALRLEIALGRNEEALRRLDIMIAAAPRKEALLLRKADLYRRSGDEAAATAAALAAADALSRLPASARTAPAASELAEKIRQFRSPR